MLKMEGGDRPNIDREIISLPLIRLIFKVTLCQSAPSLINSPLADIIVEAAFEIHQRNRDLL